MPCQCTRNRPSTRGSTGSTACRARASDRRRTTREHVHVAPLAPGAAGAERALDHPPAPDQRLEQRLDSRHRQPEPRRHLLRGERSVRPRMAGDQVSQRVAHRDQEGLGQPRGERDPQRIAVPGGILRRDEALHRRRRGASTARRAWTRSSMPDATSALVHRARTSSARTGRPPGARGRGCRRCRARGSAAPAAAARPPPRRARPRPAARGARPRPAARGAGAWSMDRACARRSASGASPS